MNARTGLKQSLRSGKPTVGTWLTLSDPAALDVLFQQPFEWFVADLEHSPLGLEAIDRLCQLARAHGKALLVRLGALDPLLIQKCLDLGAQGIILARVEDAATARRAIEAMRYPPHGSRGAGLSRAQGYGESFDEYFSGHGEEVVFAPQIETRAGLDQLEEILAVPGVDAVFSGPYDLSCSLGVPGQFASPIYRQALERLERSARERDLPLAYHLVHPRADALQELADRGYRMIALGADFLFLAESAKRAAGLWSRTTFGGSRE